MAAAKNGTKANKLDAMLSESSRRILHAMTLGRADATYAAKWIHAAECEEAVAYLLELAGPDLDVAIHRFSAASCYAKAERYAEAITLARAALSFSLREGSRREVEGCLKKWLAKAKKKARGRAGKQPVEAS